ncbi:Hsp70 family protein [Hwanghaeella sp.]|uniref:Hsp70 family protein n=1 Tax=Hwanghaeella sp. TaxID=2605943 RepID=UPI003CCBAB03
MSDWLGIDFGTSNSAAAYVEDGTVKRIRLDRESDTVPTAVFFPLEEKSMAVGSVANEALIDRLEGRYMRSLKRVLGTPLMAERRTILDRKMDFYDIVAAFLKIIKQRSEEQAGRRFDKVVAGRPVLFDSRNADIDARAASDLERCYRMAGFDDIVFLPEPEAAALSVTGAIDTDALGVVVDIGGGTSDFTAFKKSGGGIDLAASHGVQLGGTDFDRALNLKFIMPCLGHGHSIRHGMGGETITAPNAIFQDLATWEKIHMLYTGKTLTLAKGLVRDAVEPDIFQRLHHTIDWQLGHEIAFLAERSKIASNSAAGPVEIDLKLLETGLSVGMNPADIETVFSGFTDTLSETLDDTLTRAKVSRDAVSHVVPVGGASLMRLVRSATSRVVPAASMVETEIFTAVVDGLAMHGEALA